MCVCRCGVGVTGGEQLFLRSVTPVPLHRLPRESHRGSSPWLQLERFTSLAVQTDEPCDRTSAVSAERQLLPHDCGSAPFSPLPTRTSESGSKDSLGLIRSGWIVKNLCSVLFSLYIFLTFC